MMLDRNAILGAQDIKTEDVDVPEWGGAVRIGVMTGLARDEFLAGREGDTSLSRFQAAILAATIIDPDGARLFAPSDIEKLQAKNGQVLGRLADVAFRINRIGPEAEADAVKNFAADQSDASGTGLLSDSAEASAPSS